MQGKSEPSPLARGTPPEKFYDGVRYAVHPRLRGELRRAISGASMFAGSSPLTRGTRIDSGQNDRFNRFIPAYAGNSCSNAPVSATIPVHPRLRGELTSRGLPFMVVIGSSPLTRGTLAFDDASYSAARFIPAYAGNSL